MRREVFLFFALMVLIGVASCSRDDKVVGGYECTPHSIPYQVVLRRFQSRWCGGSLLNSQWILSAAHCFLQPKLLNVWIGAHDLSKNEASRQWRRITKAIRHPGYEYSTTDNDIMLFKVTPPVQLNEVVKPVRLPNSCASNGTQCLVAGWGNTVNDGEVYPDRLQCLNAPIVSDEKCQSSYEGAITPNMFCAGFLEGGKETCQVDSGGALVCAGEQQGIVSWGVGCGSPGYPGVYTKVCNYVSWINETMAAN